MRVADLVDVSTWLGGAKGDHVTMPLVMASASMPLLHFTLENVSQKAALVAPILGVVLVICKIAAIVANDLYKPTISMAKNKKARSRKVGKRNANSNQRRRNAAMAKG